MKCVLASCRNNTYINISNTVFNFPISRAKRVSWLKALKLDPNYKFDGPTGVCELHFNPYHFKKYGHIPLLSISAVPDLIVRDLPVPLEIKYESIDSSPQTTANLPKMAVIIPQQMPLSINEAAPIVTQVNNSQSIISLQMPSNNPPVTRFIQLNSSQCIIPLQVPSIKQAVSTVTQLNSSRCTTPLQELTSIHQPVTTLTETSNPRCIISQQVTTLNQTETVAPHLTSGVSSNNQEEEVSIKIEFDDENPTGQPPIAQPMIEPDSIKIEVENPDSDAADPLDPLDRIQNIQKRNYGNAALQAEMKEWKVKIKSEKQKITKLKSNLKRNAKKMEKLMGRNTGELNKFTNLRRIYQNPEWKIPRLMYDRFGIGDFDGLKYPNDLKQFAIELYSKSPVAYDYVRESLNLIIPHPDAILRWTKPPVNVENEE